MVTLIQKISISHGILLRETEKNARNLCGFFPEVYTLFVAVCVVFIFTWILPLSNFSNVRPKWLNLLNRYILIGSYCNCHGYTDMYLLVGLNECRDECICMVRVKHSSQSTKKRKSNSKDLKYRNDMILWLLLLLFGCCFLSLTRFCCCCCVAIDIFHEYDKLKNVETEKCCRPVNAEIWHQWKANKLGYLHPQNANDLVWLLLFISSLYLHSAIRSGNQADANNKNNKN